MQNNVLPLRFRYLNMGFCKGHASAISKVCTTTEKMTLKKNKWMRNPDLTLNPNLTPTWTQILCRSNLNHSPVDLPIDGWKHAKFINMINLYKPDMIPLDRSKKEVIPWRSEKRAASEDSEMKVKSRPCWDLNPVPE